MNQKTNFPQFPAYACEGGNPATTKQDLKAALAPVSSRAGQMNLAYRGSRIAALKMMNEQIRKLDPTEAWHDSNIEDAQDLDALQDSISQTLVDLQRAKVELANLRTITNTEE